MLKRNDGESSDPLGISCVNGAVREMLFPMRTYCDDAICQPKFY